MKILSIEPTPSPNSMKIVLNQPLPNGESRNYTKENIDDHAPDYIKELFSIPGVKGIFQVADFIALERNPKNNWKELLPQVRAVFGEESEQIDDESNNSSAVEHFGEVKVLLQIYRGIPMQVKIFEGEEEKRFGLPDQFREAALKVDAKIDDNLVMERKWVDHGVRYGSGDEVGEQVVEEIVATYDQQRLNELVNQANELTPSTHEQKRLEKLTVEKLQARDWETRYAALEKIPDPVEEDIPVLEIALKDEKAAIRRLAVVFLAMIESERVLPLLYNAVLHDKSVSVRRTAGDSLSDIGNLAAIPTMIKSLKDSNKLVRWRAAMFLYEVGDQSAIKALKEAQDDPEFEVAMQVKLALKRIEGGKQAEGSVWKQMTEQINKK